MTSKAEHVGKMLSEARSGGAVTSDDHLGVVAMPLGWAGPPPPLLYLYNPLDFESKIRLFSASFRSDKGNATLSFTRTGSVEHIGSETGMTPII